MAGADSPVASAPFGGTAAGVSARALRSQLARVIGEPILVVAQWPTPWNGRHQVVCVYAMHPTSLCSLAAWRDEAETEVVVGTARTRAIADRTVDVLGFEASKWSRLLLKSHAGAIRLAATSPAGATPSGHALVGLAPRLWDDVAQQSARALELDPIDRAAGVDVLVGSARFEAIDRWLRGVRLESVRRLRSRVASAA